MTCAKGSSLALAGLALAWLAAPGLAAAATEWQPSNDAPVAHPRPALSHDTLGFGSVLAQLGRPPVPETVTAPSAFDLSIAGDFDLGGFVFQDSYPLLHTDGGVDYQNTALGLGALSSLTLGVPAAQNGSQNTALGRGALEYTTEGYGNTGVGARALYTNTTGAHNTAVGREALLLNEDGTHNTAVGEQALNDNVSGARNTAVGVLALVSATGSRNIGVGYFAGASAGTGTDSIWIGSGGANESNTLRIGNSTGTGSFQLNRAFIAGIFGATGTFDTMVCVDSSNQLGPCSESSARFKEEIQEMGAASERVLDLRPVTFRYTEEFAGQGARPTQPGLIAEEVATVFPELVTYDTEGRPATVRYDLLAPLLLNELQKLRLEMAHQESEIAELRARAGWGGATDKDSPRH